jgi:hypothetical protein
MFALVPVISMAGPVVYYANVPVDHAFTPVGFDSNDNTEIAVKAIKSVNAFFNNGSH